MKKHFSSHQRITTYEVNGVKYDRLEDVPEQFRHLLEDANANGIPDFVESSADRSDQVARRVVTSSSSIRQSGSIHCAQCGYDLAGSTIGNKCPECGHCVTSSIHAFIAPQPSRFGRLVDVLWYYRGTLPFLVVAIMALLLLLAFRFIL